jgi:5-methylcytosine-specific restriction protein A
MTERTDRGADEAARHGVERSPHWPAVEREFREANPRCAACAPGASEAAVQVHHVNPFHYVKALGRPDLELDPRNLISLCETEHDRPAPDHHLLLGHLGNFKEGNLRVAADAAGEYRGMTEDAIRADADWLTEERQGRLKALDLMTSEERAAFRARLDAELPPDPAILAKYGLTIQ